MADDLSRVGVTSPTDDAKIRRMDITLYKPDGPITFQSVETCAINSGVLTFVVKMGASANVAKQIKTTVPFLIETEVEVVP